MQLSQGFRQELSDPTRFTITYELVPGAGAVGRKVDRLLEFAQKAQQDGRIRALSITDNAGGHPALAPVAIGSELKAMDIEPLVHFSLKDKNRNQIESHVFLYQRQRFHSLLILGGDFPRSGYHGQPKPVFDLDTIQTIQLIRSMQAGTYHNPSVNLADTLQQSPFFCGCVVSPFKMTEAEQVLQYAKLLKKIRAGADFVITQVGFDLVKFAELLSLLKRQHIRIPVLGNIFIPSAGVARVMHQGKVPGISLSGQLLRKIEDEQQRGDRKSRLERAASIMAVLRGLGYHGVHLGGNMLSFEDIHFVMDRAGELKGRWQELYEQEHYPPAATWYLFAPAPETAPEPAHLQTGQRPGMLFLHRFCHLLFFSRQTMTGRIFERFCLALARRRQTRWLLTQCERLVKGILFRCRMCGDCTLQESTYLCPQSGCPKQLVNGPCGGSSDGRCEVHRQRPCFWTQVYERLDPDTSITTLGQQSILPPKDWALDHTSSWINFFSGRDHTGNMPDHGNPADTTPDRQCSR